MTEVGMIGTLTIVVVVTVLAVVLNVATSKQTVIENRVQKLEATFSQRFDCAMPETKPCPEAKR